MSSFQQSLIIHLLIVVFFIGILQLRPSEDKQTFDFEIYEKITTVERKTPVINALKAPPKPKPSAPKVNKVYGVSRKSVTSNQADAIEVKKGNTLAKTPDDKKLKKDDPDSLPIPAEEFLVTSMPRVLSEVRPDYPAEAKKQGIEGAVILDILIDGEGKVRSAEILSDPGHGMGEAALAAMKKFRFAPAMMDKKSVAVKIKYSIKFVLE